MTGQLIGGGGEAMPTKGPLRAPREVPVVSSLEIERLAAEAMVGLGPGIGAAAQPAAYEDDARQPSECIVYGVNNQELLMAVPKIIKMICVHMDVCRLAAEAELSGLGRHAVQAGSAGSYRIG